MFNKRFSSLHQVKAAVSVFKCVRVQDSAFHVALPRCREDCLVQAVCPSLLKTTILKTYVTKLFELFSHIFDAVHFFTFCPAFLRIDGQFSSL